MNEYALSGDSPIRLLIVDANMSVRHALAARLSVLPQLEVTGSVGTVQEARHAVSCAFPDVVLIEPKRLSGEGLDLLKCLVSHAHPPLIIVLTSYYDEDEEMLTHELGISYYMLKDINSQALVETILTCRGASDSSFSHIA